MTAPRLEDMRQVLRVRRTRLAALERELAERRAAERAAHAQLAEARDIQARWRAASDDFTGWTRRSVDRLHRMLPLVQARREQFENGCRGAAGHVTRCEGELAQAREQLAQAQAAFVRAQARLDALQARHRDDARRWQLLTEEAVFEEAADSRAAADHARRIR